MGDFQARLQEALRRRLYPNAPLHLKEIARAIGRSENSVARWWRGETGISGGDLYEIAQFLGRQGDTKFLHDIFGDLIAGETPVRGEEQKILALLRSVIAEREGHHLPQLHFWFTADGLMQPAPAGHSDYVRRELRSPARAGDLAIYAMRVLGWIAVTERADGAVAIRHDGRRVAPLAAERICDWLDYRTDRAPQIARSINMDGSWIEAQHANAQSAAAAIAKVAFISRIERRPWIVNPMPLDAVTHPRLLALLKAYHEAPGQIVHAAAAMGAFTTSNLFGISGDDVTSHHVATSFAFDPRTVVGVNVLSRPDTEYALMVRARILRTQRDGLNYNELIGTIEDHHVRYLNLAIPEPGPEGRVLTSSVLLEERVEN